ncbi:hypothetical protein ATANTOWER_027411 [Ataeniobius toweri]|uniref:Uncharacterized protein n=1 Tax=Ataeniobius toweri TaxID=208326 RepID=A0ABU7BLC1_9TELE|nr:hypothetical protein [Ataeniobius toweri]
MSENISGNEEGGEHSGSIDKYNAIFSKPTSDELDGIVFTQSDYVFPGTERRQRVRGTSVQCLLKAAVLSVWR